MSQMLPELLDPWRAVDLGSRLAGHLPLSGLPRLRDLLAETGGEVAFDLSFGRDLEGRAVVTGKVSAQLGLCCQRCLGALSYSVDGPVSLALVRGMDEAAELPEEYDPLLVAGERVRLADLVEDELILALPQIPMHDPGECQAAAVGTDSAAAPEGTAERASPFASLAELRRGS